MQKNKYIYNIRSGVFGGKTTNDRLYQADPREIELDITEAFNTIFFAAFKKSPSNLDRYAKTYKNVAVLYDSTTTTYYSILPAAVVQFPTVGDGIRRINTMKGKDVEFMPMQQKETNLIYGSEWDNINDVIGYYLEGSIVYYYNFDPIITAVKMDLVIPFTEYAMTDDVPIPSGKDLDVVNIIRAMHGMSPVQHNPYKVDRLSNQNELA